MFIVYACLSLFSMLTFTLLFLANLVQSETHKDLKTPYVFGFFFSSQKTIISFTAFLAYFSIVSPHLKLVLIL